MTDLASMKKIHSLSEAPNLLGQKEMSFFIWGSEEDKYYQRTKKLIRAGAIPTFKIGKSIYGKKADIEAWLNRTYRSPSE